MEITLSALLEEAKDEHLLEELHGPDATVTRIDPADDAAPGALTFAETAEQFRAAVAAGATAVVTRRKTLEQEGIPGGTSVLTAPNVGLAQALIRQRHVDRDFARTGWDRIHPSAVIHESTPIPETVRVGPQAVIGPNVTIGENSVIMAGVIIEENARIGDKVVLNSGVVIGYECEIGDGVIINSNTVVGSEGYGFAQDASHRSYRIPQLGRVVIEDDVRIGANCCFDRGAYRETRIGRGTKFDNLCHVAHNVQIGEDCLLTAGFIIAGSSVIGDRVMASGQTGVLDHLKVADDVILLQRAGVVASIKEPGAYAGIPAVPFSEYKRNTATFRRITDMKKKLAELDKKLEELRDSSD